MASLRLLVAAVAVLAACLCKDTTAAFGPGMEMTSAQSIYRLPRDHALHAAAKFYRTNDFMEWYYFTSFNKDVETGEPITLFWLLNLQGFIKKTGMPFLSTLFSAHNMETGFFQNTIDYPDKLDSSGTGPEPKVKGTFGFTYLFSESNHQGNVTYDKKSETWFFKAKTETKDGSKPYDIDVQLKVYSPGYIPATPMGIETEGYNPTGDWNPQYTYGLSYYVTAPQALLTGTANLGDGKGTRKVRGTAWIEHQWGNFRGPSNQHSRYNWAWGRFDNGDLFTYRQWHAKDSQDIENGPADLSQNRYIYLRKLPGNKGFATEYALGPSIKYSVAKNHTVKNTPRDQVMPLWAKLETPQGTFYLAPEFPDQQAKTSVGLYFWEGVKYIYTDPQLKNRVGRMFGEFFEIANDKFDFVRQLDDSPNMARPLNGGLPEIPADALGPFYPKRAIKNSYKFA